MSVMFLLGDRPVDETRGYFAYGFYEKVFRDVRLQGYT